MKILIFTLCLTGLAAAQLLIPSSRGEGGYSHAEWDVFTKARFEANAPDVTPGQTATLICTTSSAFLTSSQNIYSFQAPISLQLDDSTELEVTSVFLQVVVLGSGMNAEGAVLLVEDSEGGTEALGPARTFIVSEEPLAGAAGGVGSGVKTTYGIQWDLRARPMTGAFTVLFNAASTSLSLDRVSLDLAKTYEEMRKPEPLSLVIENGQVKVTWFGGGQLQSSRTLDSGWTDVPGASGKNQITMPITESAAFFRLQPMTTTE